MQLPVATPTAIAIFVTIWWIVLFAVLPFGVRSQHEEPDRLLGTDPGAPVAPRLAMKALATTLLSIVVWAGLMAYIAWMG
jgi:predicted secreted protein